MMRRVGVLLAAAAVAGCAVAPVYERPGLPVPPSWPAGDAYLRQSEAELPRFDHRQVFADPRLQALIAQALANNQDLARAAANIAAARAQVRIQHAALFPEVGASISARESDNGGSYSAEVGVTGYEVDLFGRVRSLTSAAQARYFGTEAAARAVRLALVADIAQAWLQYAADASLLEVARQTVVTQRRSVELTRLRLNGGIAPRSDLRQAELTLHTAEADVARQTTAAAQEVNALQLLVGAPIDAALLPRSIEDAAGRIGEVPAGLDSAILLGRPDVLEAEWTLRAANAEIGAARAELFPRISLTGLLGLASSALTSLFTGGAFAWTAGASADYSIFRAGAGRANVALTQAQRNAALAEYRKAIQTAFRDVADALARQGTMRAELTAVEANLAAARDNARLAELRYRGGITSFLETLTAQQALYTAQRALVASRLTAATNRAALYRALGGDRFE